jgi:hypothetical protein
MPRDAEGPFGNADDSKRGRGLTGRKSTNKAQSPESGKGKPSRSNDDTDTDGYSVGGGTR